jgi:hypothetical protein
MEVQQEEEQRDQFADKWYNLPPRMVKPRKRWKKLYVGKWGFNGDQTKSRKRATTAAIHLNIEEAALLLRPNSQKGQLHVGRASIMDCLPVIGVPVLIEDIERSGSLVFYYDY